MPMCVHMGETPSLWPKCKHFHLPKREIVFDWSVKHFYRLERKQHLLMRHQQEWVDLSSLHSPYLALPSGEAILVASGALGVCRDTDGFLWS